jgi:alcohol dehydrogenase (cytochrome c)
MATSRLTLAAVLLAGSALATMPGAASAQNAPAAQAVSGPTSQDLLNAASDSADWMLPAGNYSDNRQVNETEITPENVGNLRVAWTFNIPNAGVLEVSPIVYHGVIYITTSTDDVYAVDAKTGQLKWQFNPKPVQIVGFPRNRGVAILEGDVFVATIDGHLIALDAATGQKKWDKLEVQDPKDSFYTMQPVPYKGQLVLGVSDGDWGGIGNISAFDPETGNRIWEWQTVPGPGEKGHNTWTGDSWKRGGASVWSGVAIDPSTDILYADLGNPQPDFQGAVRRGANLYSDSIVALQLTGRKPILKGYYQFIPHDTHDWDPAMPPVLFTGKMNGQEQKLVAAGDKAGNFWILSATAGKLISRTPVSFQYNQNSEPPFVGTNYACPNTNGGIEYNGGAYDPATNTFFVPSTNQCGKWTGSREVKYVAGEFYLGGGFPSLEGPNSGWFNAIDVSTGIFSWRQYLPLPANGGALVMTSGNDSVVFSGTLDGHFGALDAKTGKLLWHHATGASISAPPATFVMDGSRYVIVAAGAPGFQKVPELHGGTGPAVLTAFVEPSTTAQPAQPAQPAPAHQSNP